MTCKYKSETSSLALKSESDTKQQGEQENRRTGPLRCTYYEEVVYVIHHMLYYQWEAIPPTVTRPDRKPQQAGEEVAGKIFTAMAQRSSS